MRVVPPRSDVEIFVTSHVVMMCSLRFPPLSPVSLLSQVGHGSDIVDGLGLTPLHFLFLMFLLLKPYPMVFQCGCPLPLSFSTLLNGFLFFVPCFSLRCRRAPAVTVGVTTPRFGPLSHATWDFYLLGFFPHNVFPIA